MLQSTSLETSSDLKTKMSQSIPITRPRGVLVYFSTLTQEEGDRESVVVFKYNNLYNVYKLSDKSDGKYKQTTYLTGFSTLAAAVVKVGLVYDPNYKEPTEPSRDTIDRQAVLDGRLITDALADAARRETGFWIGCGLAYRDVRINSDGTFLKVYVFRCVNCDNWPIEYMFCAYILKNNYNSGLIFYQGKFYDLFKLPAMSSQFTPYKGFVEPPEPLRANDANSMWEQKMPISATSRPEECPTSMPGRPIYGMWNGDKSCNYCISVDSYGKYYVKLGKTNRDWPFKTWISPTGYPTIQEAALTVTSTIPPSFISSPASKP